MFYFLFIHSDNGKGDIISEMLVRLRNRDKTSEMQMAAAKCLTYLYRGGALMANDPIIMLKVNLLKESF